jgi:hypothetical protein
MPDFITQLNADVPTTDFTPALLTLLDFLLQSDKVSDDQKTKIARVRSQVAIWLKNL